MTKSKQDEDIGKMFDSGYRSEPKPADIEHFDESIRFYFDFITSREIDSVLDVGMGAGGFLLALQNHGIANVYGVELSHDGVELARKRFEQYGDLNHVEFFEGSFMDYSPPEVDVITLHRVIHCHPDFQGLIRKSIEINPDYIIYTLPRNTLMSKLFIGSISLLSKPITGFRAYVHPTDAISELLINNSYSLIHHSNTRFWETNVFAKENVAHTE